MMFEHRKARIQRNLRHGDVTCCSLIFAKEKQVQNTCQNIVFPCSRLIRESTLSSVSHSCWRQASFLAWTHCHKSRSFISSCCFASTGGLGTFSTQGFQSIPHCDLWQLRFETSNFEAEWGTFSTTQFCNIRLRNGLISQPFMTNMCTRLLKPLQNSWDGIPAEAKGVWLRQELYKCFRVLSLTALSCVCM